MDSVRPTAIEERILDQTAENFGRSDFSESYRRLAQAIIRAMLNFDREPDERPSP
jgi:hypothetical protein